MPAISRWLLASAVTALVLGVTLGLVLLVRRELVGAWPHPHLVSAHAHLVLVGSVMPTIAGANERGGGASRPGRGGGLGG